MKLTPTLQQTKNFLQHHGTLRKMRHFQDTPHVFGPIAKSDLHRKGYGNHTWRERYLEDGTDSWPFPNRQSLNKLVIMGYAEYTDKAKTEIVFVDKDAKDAEKDRLAKVGKAFEDIMKEPTAILSGDNILIEQVSDLLEWAEAQEALNETKASSGR